MDLEKKAKLKKDSNKLSEALESNKDAAKVAIHEKDGGCCAIPAESNEFI